MAIRRALRKRLYKTKRRLRKVPGQLKHQGSKAYGYTKQAGQKAYSYTKQTGMKAYSKAKPYAKKTGAHVSKHRYKYIGGATAFSLGAFGLREIKKANEPAQLRKTFGEAGYRKKRR